MSPAPRRRATDGGLIPARQLRRVHPRAVAYAMAWSTPASNSSTRSGRQAIPRSPAAQLPAGRLCSTCVRPNSSRRARSDRGVVRVRKEVFDAHKAGGGRRREAVEKVDFIEQHRQIGGELGHAGVTITGERANSAEKNRGPTAARSAVSVLWVANSLIPDVTGLDPGLRPAR